MGRVSAPAGSRSFPSASSSRMRLAKSRSTASFFFFQAEDGIRDGTVTGVQTCALPISVMAVAATLALSALSLIPTSQRWFTPLGSASLVVYLFHGFFVKAAEYADVGRSEERRVGKECRPRGWLGH